MVYMKGLYFALQSGKEHRQLRSSPCQIEVIKKGERPYLEYTEDTSKNHSGGLRGRKMKQKVVIHHANQDHPECCFVRLFKCYLDFMPANRPPGCLLLPAFTPSNINMLVLLYTTGTPFTRQNHQPNMQGSRHWWLQNQPLSTCNYSHQAVPVWSR